MTDRISEIRARCEAAKGEPCPADNKSICWELRRAYEDIPYLLDRFAEAEAEVERLREAQRWVLTSQGLPDSPDKMVLAIVSGKPHENITLHNAYELAIYNAEDGWILESYPEWEGAIVTNRMPLPEPPEEGEPK